jgi:hypothetical protein
VIRGTGRPFARRMAGLKMPIQSTSVHIM